MTLTELRTYLIELAIKTYNNQYLLDRKYEDFDIITISHKNFKYAFEVFAKAKEDPLKFRMYLDSDLNTQLGLYKIFEHANGWVGNGDEVYVAIGTLSKDIYSPYDKKPVFTSEYRKEPEEQQPEEEDTPKPPAEEQEKPQPEEPSVGPGQEGNIPPAEGEDAPPTSPEDVPPAEGQENPQPEATPAESEQEKTPVEPGQEENVPPVVEQEQDKEAEQPKEPVESSTENEPQQEPSESVDEKQENV